MASLQQPNQPVVAAASTSVASLAPPKLFKPASLKPQLLAPLPSLDSLPVSLPQVNKAVHALLTHIGKRQEKAASSSSLLLGEREEKVYLVCGLKRSANREIHKPIQLQLAHPVMDPRASSVTLFVKDPQREYKDLLESTGIKFISRVIGLDKLRNKHKTFEAKRLLLKESDLFLVDDRVMTEVGKSLGKQWREAKKQPVTVSLVRKDLKGELERAISATYLSINTGTSLSIKVGTTELHSPTELYENLLALLPQLAVRLPHGGWDNLQSLHLKTSTSISLPLYNVSLDVAGRFSGPSTAELEAVAGKAQEKQVIKDSKLDKIKVRDDRRIEREAEKEKREKSQKEGGSKERKERKRKAAEEAAAAGSSEGGKAADDVEEETLALDAPITSGRVSKKAKTAPVVEEAEETVEVDMEVEEPVAVAVKEKKSKKAAAAVAVPAKKEKKGKAKA